MKSHVVERCPPSEEPQLYEHGHTNDFCPEFLHETDRGGGRPAGGKNVIDDEHTVTWTYTVAVHLEGIGPVLEFVGLPDDLGG